MNLMDLAKNFSNEESAIAYLEAKLWPNGPVCPHCGIIGEAFKMQSKAGTKNKMRPGLWKCSECRKTFRVTVGTIFEDSHIPLHKWMMAIHLMSASKKGMSAHQLHRMLGLGYRAAWFMAHRIRYAMAEDAPIRKMSGTVEVDETYVGGKLRVGPHATKPGERPRDRAAAIANKTAVVALVERNGKVRSFPMERVTAKNLKPILMESIAQDAILNTDESKVYRFARKHFAGHDVVNHAAKEYSRTEADGRVATTNTVEGFFSLLKRGVYGTFHHVGKQHLHRYCDEFDFRYNAREVDDGERSLLALKGMVGKRLTYRKPSVERRS
jgi:transposase-like protein